MAHHNSLNHEQNQTENRQPKEFKSFYKNVCGGEGSRCHYTERLDSYGCGCQHDCSYCYAKSLLSFRGLWDSRNPRVADIKRVRRKIATFKEGQVIRLGGMTDCFQPYERTHRVTYEAIKELNKRRVHYLIVTKSPLVASDEYMAVMDRDLAHIQVSVTTTDDQKSLEYEKAAPPSKRIAAIEKLQRNGFDVQLRLSPFIEEYIDFDVLNQVRCDKILVEFLRVNHWVKKWFDINYSRYTLKEGGYLHLPLEEKRRMLEQITGFKELSVCEDVNSHYLYWQDNLNVNPADCCNLRRGPAATQEVKQAR